jgi:hypothetical protein
VEDRCRRSRAGVEADQGWRHRLTQGQRIVVARRRSGGGRHEGKQIRWEGSAAGSQEVEGGAPTGGFMLVVTRILRTCLIPY